jgi:hypothetical protein
MRPSFFTKLSSRVLTVLLLGVLAGCSENATDEEDAASEGALKSSGEDLAPEVDDAISRIAWQPLGTGVSYKPVDPSLANVLIIYGGYTAQDKWVQRWCDEMIRVKNDTLGIGHLYAVKGPDTVGYSDHGISNSKLAAHLASESRAQNATHVIVIAHSSGTYVADEFFSDVGSGSGGIPADTVGKIDYFDLDGGGPGNVALLKRYAHAHFVFGFDSTIKRYSHNADGMKSLGKEYASLGGGVQVNADGSSCDPSASGGLWCMHDTLINTKPHNPRMYDLARDYSDFAPPHGLVTSYLDSIAPIAESTPSAPPPPPEGFPVDVGPVPGE